MRKWELYEDGIYYDEIEASSLEEALEEARSNVDRDHYDTESETIWVDVRVQEICMCDDHSDDCTCDLEMGRDVVAIDPEEPPCSDDYDGHEWTSPEWLGGCSENPGVWGHGGGVVVTEICAHCGMTRVTDTWAQRRDTGEQGLTSVSYNTDNVEEWERQAHSQED